MTIRPSDCFLFPFPFLNCARNRLPGIARQELPALWNRPPLTSSNMTISLFIHFFHSESYHQATQVIIMALASTNNIPVPSGKELVLLCMDYRDYENEDAFNSTKFKLGENMIWVGCPNCNSGTLYMYSTDFPVKHGFTNPCNHFVWCVGNNNNMMKIVHAHLHAKQL
jgi:hypothetical protein